MNTLKIREVGKIREIKKSIARIVGFSRILNGQFLEISENTTGIVVGFSKGEVLAFLLGRLEDAKVGGSVYSEMKPFTIPVGKNFLGRIVDALAKPVDGKSEIVVDENYPVFRSAPGVLERVPIIKSLETGTLVIDATVPIGKGQRELIVGDRMTGKTTLCVDAILNQKDKNVICIYCCIGRSYADLQKTVEILKLQGALEYTIIVQAHAASTSGEQYLVPYTACTLGEYFMDRGRDVLVVFDDLTKHAWAYRQLSLLLERSLGREAYPGDIFYVHSQLMERAGKYSAEFGSGSMTFLPIVDTLQGDVTGLIPSNLISMTDGQIYLDVNLFNSGIKPAVDLGLSVSRIGNKAQCEAMRELSSMLRLDYVRYKELLKLTRFKSSPSESITKRIKEGEVIAQLFSQKNNNPYSLIKQIVLLYALKRRVLEVLTKEEIEHFKDDILVFLEKSFPSIIQSLKHKTILFSEIKKELDKGFIEFFKGI